VNCWPDVDASVLRHVTATADMFIALGAPLPEAERDWICRQLAKSSERFRAARKWTRWYNAALSAGGLLFAVATTSILLGLPAWVSAMFATASLVVVVVPGVRVVRILRQALTVAVGACAMDGGLQ
jgi:hypothetical protein